MIGEHKSKWIAYSLVAAVNGTMFLLEDVPLNTKFVRTLCCHWYPNVYLGKCDPSIGGSTDVKEEYIRVATRDDFSIIESGEMTETTNTYIFTKHLRLPPPPKTRRASLFLFRRYSLFAYIFTVLEQHYYRYNYFEGHPPT